MSGAAVAIASESKSLKADSKSDSSTILALNYLYLNLNFSWLLFGVNEQVAYLCELLQESRVVGCLLSTILYGLICSQR